MKIMCLACEALARVVYHCAAQSPHMVDVSLNKLGLHNQPQDLRQLLQQQIDDQMGKGYDYITLAYGLCGLATAGLTPRDTPLVMPRAHDCITLFLGDRNRYEKEQRSYPGTYWYVQDFIERGRFESEDSTHIIWGLGSDGNIQDIYQQFIDKYGQDNADYLMQFFGNWQSNYQRGVYIDMGIGYGEEVDAVARQESTRFGWQFERMAGDPALIQRLLNGDWDDDFLLIKPGWQVTMAAGNEIIYSGMKEI